MSAEPVKSAEDDKDDEAGAPRQPIVRQRGARRAKLLPAPDTDPSPDLPIQREDGGVAPAGAGPGGENDERLRRDRPPHW